MACPICGGGGDRYECENEDCDMRGAIACNYCVEIYEYKCPYCGHDLVETEWVSWIGANHEFG